MPEPRSRTAGGGATRARPNGRIAYVDGRYLPHGQATVHVEDRGLQFADAVYEVFAVVGGKLLDEQGHLERLERSLGALDMKTPMARPALRTVIRELARRNRLNEGLIYLQVTRGSHRRDHPIPSEARPTLIVTARPMDKMAMERRRAAGVRVVTRPDIRWGRCDIKSTGLLPNVLAKTEARRAGAHEAWLVDGHGFVTEGTSTNAWIMTKDHVVVTRHLASNILAGVTRSGVLAVLASHGIAAEERSFTLEEALAAQEAFITSATGGVIPVIAIDGHEIGGGRPGPCAHRLQMLYQELAENVAV